ncbi:MAG: hypothetical protein Q7U50_09425 [Candidatus Nitrotoga sp.]|nr:hypothetical protein [Candidatus Nitrotoga sp.]MDP3498031.1 hypothetical protein [Candidatus Nitrotoga sp.]
MTRCTEQCLDVSSKPFGASVVGGIDGCLQCGFQNGQSILLRLS